MENKKILELALESLENQKLALEAEITSLRTELAGKAVAAAVPVARLRRSRTAAERKAQADRMRAYWAAKKRMAAKPRGAKKPARGKSARGPQSAAARKAQSEKMKAYWANRKAAASKAARKPAAENTK